MASESVVDESQNQMPVPKIRHDWYQTNTHVIINVLAKNTKNVQVGYGERTLNVSAELPNGNDYSLKLDLAHHIVPDQSVHKVISSKVEILLKKRDECTWKTLEGSQVAESAQPIPSGILQAVNEPPKYPSSSKISKNWDKVEKEIEKEEAAEKKDDEANINALFSEIYSKGSDEVRRAMNKSFQESGGTVLSTNWSEVCNKPVEMKAPDCLEWKSWN